MRFLGGKWRNKNRGRRSAMDSVASDWASAGQTSLRWCGAGFYGLLPEGSGEGEKQILGLRRRRKADPPPAAKDDN
jgi:hypothetical protein